MGALPAQIPFVTNRAVGNFAGNNGHNYGGANTPDGASRATSANGFTNNTSANPIQIFEELKDSPSIDFGEQATIVHRFKVDPFQTNTLLFTYVRGSIWTDSFGLKSRVLNVRADYQEGDFYIVAVTSEGVNFYIPPSTISIDPIEINPAAQKHPRYAPLQQKFGAKQPGPSNPNYTPFYPLNVINQAVLGLSISKNGPTSPATIQALVNANNWYVDSGTDGTSVWSADPDLVAQASALELLKKLRRGEETFYLAGYKVTFKRFSFMPQDLDPGGRIEDPTTSGAIPPEYFTDVNGDSIFDALTLGGTDPENPTPGVSPQFYANGVGWFRQADSQFFQRTWWEISSTWLMGPAGGPIDLSYLTNGPNTYQWYGQWDKEWYSPAAPGDSDYPPYDIDLNIA